jgi:hypothetical protein
MKQRNLTLELRQTLQITQDHTFALAVTPQLLMCGTKLQHHGNQVSIVKGKYHYAIKLSIFTKS